MNFLLKYSLIFIAIYPSFLQCEMGDVLHTIPAPGFYSTGLAWNGDHLWVVNIADAAHPDNIEYQIYEISPEDGTIVSSIPTYPWFYHGLTYDGEFLWGEHNYTEVVKMTTSGLILQEFQVPPLSVGLAIDRVNDILFISTTQPGMILVMDTATGLVLNELFPQEGTENGWGDLAFDGVYLWHTNVATDFIYQIDAQSGEIVNQFEAPSGQCEGLTFDGQFLWISDSNQDLIYKVDIEFEPTDPCEEWEMGDSNLDGFTNVLDILTIVNCILQPCNDLTLCQTHTMDLNSDGAFNVIDILLIVNIILEGI